VTLGVVLVLVLGVGLAFGATVIPARAVWASLVLG
jgi:hypothetical protein